MDLSSILNKHGILYDVTRNQILCGSYKGYSNFIKESGVKYIGFHPETDIKPGDVLDNHYHERFYVYDTNIQFIQGAPFQLRVFYKTESEYQAQQASTSNIFNVQNVYGSVLGSQSVVNMNYNASIESTKQQISNSESPDKEELTRIINLLEMLVNDQIPAQKGLLSKFSSVIERNSWIASPIASILLNWLTTQVM